MMKLRSEYLDCLKSSRELRDLNDLDNKGVCVQLFKSRY